MSGRCESCGRRSEIAEIMLEGIRRRMEANECSIEGCSRRINRDVRLLRICYEHGLEVARKYEPRVLADARARDAATVERRVERRESKVGNREGSLVYYARIGNYVKIGYSTRLRNRLTTLRVDELLAVEPGGAELERQRHGEFARDRIDQRRENFIPSDELTQHIEDLRERHGLPKWASRPRTSTITRRQLEDR